MNPILGPVAAAFKEVANESFREKARAAIQAFWDTTAADPGRQLLSYELASWSVRGDGEAARLLYKTYLDIIEAFLSDGLGLRGTSEVTTRTVARMVLTLTDGATLAWLVDRDEEATLAVVKNYLSMLLNFVEDAIDRGALVLVDSEPPAQTAAVV